VSDLLSPIQVFYSTDVRYDATVVGEKKSRPVSESSQRGVYAISVAADLAGTGVQNLRLYERRGLLEPSRSAGGTRLYSADDVDRLLRITDLLAEGLNLAGVAMVLELQDDNSRLRDQANRRSAQPSLGRSSGKSSRADHGPDEQTS
jgi:MerR family transcriptional regulator/heat shock protein HspR